MKKKESLEDILGSEREFSEEEMKLREAQTMRLFRILACAVGAAILLLVLSGILFGGK